MSLRDKIDGNELDLSLNLLKDVPVKELALAKKATHVDISCNHIETLPSDFATLTHLVKIDLSKNRLTELPSNFGNLVNLQILDLYSNQITDLPLSFSRLRNLQWLDLKNNPLSPCLKSAAGNCLSEKECKECAKKVVAHMQVLESDHEREKQKKLKTAREKAAIEKVKLEKELEEQRRFKKIEKEKRKAESRAKRESMLSQQKEAQNNVKELHPVVSEEVLHKKPVSQDKGFSCIKLMAYVSVILSLFLLSGFLWALHIGLISFSDMKSISFVYISDIQSSIRKGNKYILHLGTDFSKLGVYYGYILYEYCLQLVKVCILNVTIIASDVERMLEEYFN